MGRQKFSKKMNKKGYNNVVDDQQQTSHNSSKRNSPRRRKRNVNTLSADDYKLRQTIEGDGTSTIIDIEADGNCLFRSISDQLYYDYGDNHMNVRQEICDYIEGHKDDFSFFLVLDDKDAGENEEDASDFETYISNMRQDGDWGGHLELVAASRMYRRCITVYSARLEKFTIQHESSKQSAGPDLLLSYHDNDHYNSIRLNAATKPPPPIKTFVLPNKTSAVIDVDLTEDVSDGTEMVLDENTTTTTISSSSGTPETTADVEMSDTTSLPPSTENKNDLSSAHQTSTYLNAVVHGASSSNKNSLPQENAVDLQFPDTDIETILIPANTEFTPTTVTENVEPITDGNFQVLHI